MSSQNGIRYEFKLLTFSILTFTFSIYFSIKLCFPFAGDEPRDLYRRDTGLFVRG